MSITLFSCTGGKVVLPAGATVFVDRRDGGNLVVDPPTAVWDRTELSPEKLTRWAFLVAATAKAMLTVLPTLKNGCINYWDAGNWALHHDSGPVGQKSGPVHRSLHMHLLARSVDNADPRWRWGEAPQFSDFADRVSAAQGIERLSPDECSAIVSETSRILQEKYGFAANDLDPWEECPSCGYPVAKGGNCDECRT